MKNALRISVPVLLAVLFFGFSAQSAFAASENITQIVFKTSSQSVVANATSTVLTTETQNTGVLEEVSTTTVLNLSSTSVTGQFSSSNTNWSPVTTLTMASSTAHSNFYYRDSTPGTYTLTVSAQGQSWASATQTITVTAPSGGGGGNIPVTGVTVADSFGQTATTTLQVSASVSLTATIAPSNATNSSVSWSSNHADKASVDASTGVVTGVAAGTAIITATASDTTNGTLTASYNVTVVSSGPNYTTIFGDIKTTLAGPGPGIDIDTNIDTCASTPTACTGLYFEKTGKGRVTFSASLDLTDSATNTFLQNLGSKMDASAGSMHFDATTATQLKNAGAQIAIYGLNNLGITAVPNIVVKNDSGTVLVPGSTGYPTLSSIAYASANSGTLTFSTNHFTQFDTKKVIDTTTGIGYDTIQAAITAANSGDTINVSAGTYTEIGQIVIDKNLSIVGADKATTIIKPNADTGSSGDGKGWWLVNSGIAFNLSGVTLDGTGYKIFHGIRHKGTGTIQNVHFTNIAYNASGSDYAGFAIYAFGQVGAVDVSNSVFDNIGREGIAYWGAGTTGTYTNNTYTGKGLGNWLDYGVEVTNSASTTISNSTITNNRGTATSDGSVSAGIIVLLSGSKATITGNTLTGNTIGIKVGYDSSSSAEAHMHSNNISSNYTSNAAAGTDATFDATNNWWGSSVLATVASGISGSVSFKPYYINSGMTTLSDIKAISAFNFATPAATGVINESAHTIAITVPFGTDVTALVPTITTPGASVSPASGVAHNFTGAQTYTVTAVDEATTQDYIVTVTISANPDIASVAAAKSALAGAGTLNPSEGVNTNIIAMAQSIIDGTPSASGVIATTTASANAQVAANGGAITYGSSQVTGNVTFTLTKGVVNDTQTVSVIVPAHTPTDAELVASDKSALVNNLIRGTNAVDLASVTANLSLITSISGGAGSTISWASNNTAIATTTSVVTRPAYGAGNATVTLTATITKGSASDTKTFSVTVIESLNSAKAITAFSFATPAASGVINETDHTITVNVPHGTVLTALVPTISMTGASISPTSGSANDFTATSTYKVMAGNSTTQAYAVKVTVLEETQKAPDASGAATIDSTTPEVVITNPTQAVDVTISSGTDNPTIDVGAFITGGTGTLPAISITSANAGNTNVEIPASTVVTSASTTWDGIIAAPTITTITLPDTSGQTKTLSTAIEIGFSGEELSFSKAVRILLVGQAGKRAGYVRTGIDFTEITNTCSADTQVAGDALAADSECKIDAANGLDLVIWTKHFTTFATYTQTTNSTGGGSSSGGGSILSFGGVGGASNPIPGATASTGIITTTTTSNQGQVLGASTYHFANNLFVGSKGSDVTALQQFLIDSGYSIPAGATGYFGSQTKTAVIAYQKANKLPQTGFVGSLTRAELNKGTMPTSSETSSGMTDAQVNALIAVMQSFGLDQAAIARVQAALGK